MINMEEKEEKVIDNREEFIQEAEYFIEGLKPILFLKDLNFKYQGKSMINMKLKVQCSSCGKKGKVLIILKKILSLKWVWWGIEWECKKCYNIVP